MRKITKRSLAIGTAAVIAVGGGAAAWAWSLNGTGSTSATAEGAVGLVISNANAGGLAPNVAAPVSFVIDNGNKYPVKVTSVILSNLVGPSGCPASNVTINGTTDATTGKTTLNLASSGGLQVGAAGAVHATSNAVVNGALTMSKTAPAGCQNAVFTMTVDVVATTDDVS